jgi:hypothetical protein
LLTAPRGLTQPTTSFIGSWRQGIPRTPFLAQRAHLVRHSRQAGRIGSISLIVDVNHSSVVKVLGAGSPSCSSHHALPGANKNGLAPARPPRLHSDETTPWSGTLVLSRWRACLQLDAPAFFVRRSHGDGSPLYRIPYPRAKHLGTNFRTLSALRFGVRVGVPGLEPGTSVLSGLRSNQLS